MPVHSNETGTPPTGPAGGPANSAPCIDVPIDHQHQTPQARRRLRTIIWFGLFLSLIPALALPLPGAAWRAGVFGLVLFLSMVVAVADQARRAPRPKTDDVSEAWLTRHPEPGQDLRKWAAQHSRACLRDPLAPCTPRTLVTRLHTHGAWGLTIRAAPAAQLTPLAPLSVPFEPTLLQDLVRVLADGPASSPARTAPDHRTSTAGYLPAQLRRIALETLHAVAVVLMVQLSLALICWRGGLPPTGPGSLWLWLGLVVMIFGVLPLLLTCLARRRQLLLVPSAVLVNHVWRPTARRRLFQRSNSVLCLLHLPCQVWSFCLTDGRHTISGRLSDSETAALLAAWCSPLPTPNPARLEEAL